MSATSRRILDSDIAEAITKALRESVEAMPAADRESASVIISGAPYSTVDLLTAIDRRTPVGVDILEALGELQQRMRAKNPNASVAELIRRSAEHEASASASGD